MAGSGAGSGEPRGRLPTLPAFGLIGYVSTNKAGRDPSSVYLLVGHADKRPQCSPNVYRARRLA